MTNTTIDARGLSCPQPVILCKNAIAQHFFPFFLFVDSDVAMENVQRLAEKKGCQVTVEKRVDDYKLTISKTP